MSGRRELVDDKAVLSEVSKLLHASKANKKIIVNTRKTAKLAASKPASPTSAASPAPPKKIGGKKDAGKDAQVIPPNAVLRKAGGAVWVMLKCQFDTEAIRAREAAREALGKPVEPFVLPATNARYRMRMAKIETAAAAEAAAEEEEGEPAAAEEGEEEAAEEDGGDDVADAPAEGEEEAEEAVPTRTESLLATYGAGAAKCIVRTKSSAARKVRRAPLPPPEGATSADAKVRAKAETSERRQCRRRRVKQQKATSVLASQKVAANFTAQLVALLRKDVYPNMKRGGGTASATTAGASGAPAQAKHADPNAETQPTGAAAQGKQQASQQDQQSNQKSGGGKSSGKNAGKGKKK